MLPDRPKLRRLFVEQTLAPQLNRFTTTLRQGSELAPIIAKLNSFCGGGRMNIATPTSGGHYGDMKALRGYADVLVEFRFSDAVPQHRLLGAFIAKDLFVAHSLVLRSALKGSWSLYCKTTLKAVTNLGTPSLNCISHTDPNNLLSNWKYAK